jgi:hypothetical protein
LKLRPSSPYTPSWCGQGQSSALRVAHLRGSEIKSLGAAEEKGNIVRGHKEMLKARKTRRVVEPGIWFRHFQKGST